jgi:hypothetical protein
MKSKEEILIEIVRRLLKKTERGKLAWKKNMSDNYYYITVKSGELVSIRKYKGGKGADYISFEIRSESGLLFTNDICLENCGDMRVLFLLYDEVVRNFNEKRDDFLSKIRI